MCNVMGYVKQHGLEFKSLAIQSAKKIVIHNLWAMVLEGQELG